MRGVDIWFKTIANDGFEKRADLVVEDTPKLAFVHARTHERLLQADLIDYEAHLAGRAEAN
jgi:hypothetical protein